MDHTIEWLMEGDPAIRWQTLRDLLDAPKSKWQAERKKVATEGWGARLLSLQDNKGVWGGGLYAPKWISSTYTLLQLRDLGLPPQVPAAHAGTRVLLDGMLGKEKSEKFPEHLENMDLCIVGMMLALAVYFQVVDSRVDAILVHLKDHEMPDGGWNCRSKRIRVSHSSFHTTFNVLDGVRQVLESKNRKYRAAMRAAEGRALELLYQHKLFRSDKTNKIIYSRFVDLTYPFRWHYDILRGLDYMQRANVPRDPRAAEAIELLESKRLPDGTWKNEYRYAGKSFFDMEKVGKASRWNTLRALRALRWWNESG
jgi:hypothetical protein